MALKKVLLVLCLMLMPMLVYAQGPEVKEQVALKEDSGKTREGVLATLRNYIRSFEAKDIDGVMAAFADSPDTVLMGTGPDEVWIGKDDIRTAHNAFMDNFEEESSEQTIISVGADGRVAWLTGYSLVKRMESASSSTFQVNISMVLEQIENTWYIKAMHFSILTGP